MQKKALISISILSVVAVILVSVLWLTGVFSMKNNDMNLTDISGFEKLTAKPSSIKVVFSDEYEGEYTTVDEEQINVIYELLMERIYVQRKKGELKPPGTNRSLTFIYDDSIQISFDASWVKAKDGRVYSPETNDNSLDNYLQKVGLLLGGIVLK